MSVQWQRISNAAGGLVGLVASSVVAAVLITAVAIPLVAVAGTAAGSTIDIFNNLPDYIELSAQSQQNRIYANRDGKPVQIATIYDQNRQVATWDEVSPFLKQAAVAGEDRRFYQHGGVDVTAAARATVGNLAHNAITSGGSTIDMQLVRNVLVQQALRIDDPQQRKQAYQAAISDTIDRKLKEMKLAIGLDARYSKKEILLGYLNITGFGGSTYGVEAAANQYFSVDAKDVTLAQAASLIAIVQQPNKQNLSSPSMYPANQARRDEILRDMFELNYITKAQFDEAIATPIAKEVKLTPPTSGCLYAADAKFACDYVSRLVPTLEALGKTAAQRAANWAVGGYQIYTSIDLNQQDVAQANLDKSAPATETRFQLGASAVSVQPGTGRILLMAQNKRYDNSAAGSGSAATAVNFNTDRAYGQSSGFQTGSAYKIFTLIDWLQHGHGLYDSVNGTPHTFQLSHFDAPCVGSLVGTYAPPNDTRFESGYMSVLRATQDSVNVAYMSMAEKLDLCDIRDDATALGVHRADGAPLKVVPSSVLGTNEIAPLSMAGAIAAIGANGMYCAPTIIDKVVGSDGKELAGQPRQCTQAIAPNIASTVAYALAAVMKSGTGVAGDPRDGVPIVGKTGTTDLSVQNWLVGTTTKAALAVWVGNISGSQDLQKIRVAGTNGYNTKFNIFRAVMTSLDANAAYRGSAFPAPDPKLIRRPIVVPPPKPVAPPPDTSTPPPSAPPSPGPDNGADGGPGKGPKGP